MPIEVDQSGKIENTNKPTVIGFSNGKAKTIIILAIEKQKLQRRFRKNDKPNIFVYKVFAILITLLLKNEHLDQIIIDTEYIGQEALIKNYLLDLLRKNRKNIDKRDVCFKQIGKKSKAHILVYTAYKSKKANIKIKAEDIYKLI